MELVDGIPITNYCDQEKLSLRQRLELFVNVCRAVQHAHQKGIIHRDLKPSNILVVSHDGLPAPKIIDFGIAKAINRRLTEATVLTQFAELVGTPLYMSPEQAELGGQDIDTRTDIYSLGVVLYELLAGTTPVDAQRLGKSGFDEMRRIIREEDPPKPSTRLSSLGANLPAIAVSRGIDPKRLGRELRGELDWIVMKALEKDRTRRYATAHDFAADVERYLKNEAVEACPPSVGYRFRKFSRRNRLALTTAGLVAAALVAGTTISIWQAILAHRAEHRAEQETARAKTESAIASAVNDFLNNDLLLQASPERATDRELKLRTVLERASKRIEGRFQDQPLVEAAIRATLGESLNGVGDYVAAERHYRRAAELYRETLGPDDEKALVSLSFLAVAVGHQRRLQEARQIDEQVLTARQRMLGPEHPDTLSTMSHVAALLRDEALDPARAQVVLDPSKLEQSRKLFEEVLELQRRVLGPEKRDTLITVNNLANVLSNLGRHTEAKTYYQEAIRIKEKTLGRDHPATVLSINNLAILLMNQGQLDDARRLYEETIVRTRRRLGPDHQETLKAMNGLAWTLVVSADPKMRNPVRGIELAKEVADRAPKDGDNWNTLGVAYYRAGDWKNALATLEKSIKLRNGGDSFDWFFLAMTHWQLGHKEEARKWYDRAVAWMEKNRPKDAEFIQFRGEAAKLLGITPDTVASPKK